MSRMPQNSRGMDGKTHRHMKFILETDTKEIPSKADIASRKLHKYLVTLPKIDDHYSNV